MIILFANAGIPMLAIVWPIAWLTFVPVVLLESTIAWKSLGLAFRRSVFVTAVANGVSTLVGIPVIWFTTLLLEWIAGGGQWHPIDTPTQKMVAVLSQAAWLSPYEHDLGWMIPAAALALCIPFFLASVGIEYLIVRRMVPNTVWQVCRFCLLANLATYLLIALFWGWRLSVNL